MHDLSTENTTTAAAATLRQEFGGAGARRRSSNLFGPSEGSSLLAACVRGGEQTGGLAAATDGRRDSKGAIKTAIANQGPEEEASDFGVAAAAGCERPAKEEEEVAAAASAAPEERRARAAAAPGDERRKRPAACARSRQPASAGFGGSSHASSDHSAINEQQEEGRRPLFASAAAPTLLPSTSSSSRGTGAEGSGGSRPAAIGQAAATTTTTTKVVDSSGSSGVAGEGAKRDELSGATVELAIRQQQQHCELKRYSSASVQVEVNRHHHHHHLQQQQRQTGSPQQARGIDSGCSSSSSSSGSSFRAAGASSRSCGSSCSCCSSSRSTDTSNNLAKLEEQNERQQQPIPHSSTTGEACGSSSSRFVCEKQSKKQQQRQRRNNHQYQEQERQNTTNSKVHEKEAEGDGQEQREKRQDSHCCGNNDDDQHHHDCGATTTTTKSAAATAAVCIDKNKTDSSDRLLLFGEIGAFAAPPPLSLNENLHHIITTTTTTKFAKHQIDKNTVKRSKSPPCDTNYRLIATTITRRQQATKLAEAEEENQLEASSEQQEELGERIERQQRKQQRRQADDINYGHDNKFNVTKIDSTVLSSSSSSSSPSPSNFALAKQQHPHAAATSIQPPTQPLIKQDDPNTTIALLKPQVTLSPPSSFTTRAVTQTTTTIAIKPSTSHQHKETAVLLDTSSSSNEIASSTSLAPNVFSTRDKFSVPWTTIVSSQLQQQNYHHPIVQNLSPQPQSTTINNSKASDNKARNSSASYQIKHQQTSTLLNYPGRQLAAIRESTPIAAIKSTSSPIVPSKGQQTFGQQQSSTSARNSVAMHNFGTNLQEQKKTDIPWPNNLNSLQQHIQQQLQQQNANTSSASPAHPQSLQQQQQQYGSYSPHAPNNNSNNNTPLPSTIASRVDQIIRTTLYDSIHTPKSINNNIHNNNLNANSKNMPSPSSTSSLIFNPANLSISTAQNFSSSAAPGLGMISASSPLSSYYGSGAVTTTISDTLNNNMMNSGGGGNSNLATKMSAHTASHSALAAAAALQSLNQSHLPRPHQSAQSQQQQSSTRPPSDPLSTSSPHMNSSNMPKLGITSTTSSDHQNHNHLALLGHQQQLENSEFSARFQPTKLPHEIRPPINWQQEQQQLASLNQNSANHRWLYANPYSTNFTSSTLSPSGTSLPTGAVNNLSNSNNMIGPNVGDGDISSRLKTERAIWSQAMSQNFDMKVSGANTPKNNTYQCLDNMKRSSNPLQEAASRREHDQRCLEEYRKAGPHLERLSSFVDNLLSNSIPGTEKPKKMIHIDSIEGLRQSINNGEFYTKYEEIAIGILTFQILVPEFDIIEYIRREQFLNTEMLHMDNVHKKLGFTEFMGMIKLAVGVSPTRERGPDMKQQQFHASDATSNLSIGTGLYYPQQSFNLQTPSKSSSFITQLPGKSDITLANNEKSRRSSQSPSDIFSRSQSSNGPAHPKGFNTHSSALNFPGIAASTIPSSHLPPPPPINQRNRCPPPARSSSLHPSIAPNPYMMIRPQRSDSTIGFGAAQETSMMNLSTSSTGPSARQPPAAHQSSSARTSMLGSNPNVAHAHLSSSSGGPPVTAHMSSKTPQTPRLNPPVDNISISNKIINDNFSPSGPRPADERQNKAFGPPPVATHFTSIKSDINSMTGLPAQTLLGLKHNELVNRSETALKRVGTPQFSANATPHGNQNLIALQPHGIDIARSPVAQDTHLNSRSPHLNPALQNMNGRRLPKGPTILPPSSGPNFGNMHPATTSMPPPSMEYRKSPTHNDSHGPSNDHRSSMISPHNTLQYGNDTQLKHYPSFSNIYQQQQQQQHILMTNKSPSIPLGLHPNSTQFGIHPPIRSPQSSNNDAMLLDLQNHMQSVAYLDGRANSLPQQPSPKQNNQRSIITGSASSGSKRNKKVKLSPSNNQPHENKSSTSPNDMMSNSYPINKSSFNVDPRSNLAHSLIQNIEGENNTCTGGGQSESLYSSKSINDSSLLSVSMNDIPSTYHDGQEPSALKSVTSETQLPISHSIAESDNVATSNAVHSAQSTIPIESTCAQENNKLDGRQSSLSSHIANSEPSKAIFVDKSFDKSINDKLSQAVNDSLETSTAETIPNLKTEENLIEHQTNDRQAPQGSDTKIFPSSLTTEPPSKYQKFYTKKFWLKNYDEEVQARDIKPDSDEIAAVVNEIKTENMRGAATTKEMKSMPSKNTKITKADPKKKNRDVTGKKTNQSTLRASRTAKVVYNDSEVSNASTSELDSAETDSSKSSKYKKLRRTPRRKVKPSSDREEQRSPKPKLVVKDPPKKKTKKGKVMDEFLQTKPCQKLVPKNIRCLECRRVRKSSIKNDKEQTSKQSKTNWDDFCRFYEFRKLRRDKTRQVVVAGFLDMNDAKESDKKLWAPTDDIPDNISFHTAKFIVNWVGAEFENLVKQEREVIRLYQARRNDDKRITWKRTVDGLRELCDVCATTLFNCHYVCERCGFVVCIDCHRFRASRTDSNSSNSKELSFHGVKNKSIENLTPEKSSNNTNCIKSASDAMKSNQPESLDQSVATVSKKSKKDLFGWIYCSKNEEHSHDKLLLAQIIAGDCLEELWNLLLRVRKQLNESYHRIEFSDGSSDEEGEDLSEETEAISQQVAAVIEGCLSTVAKTNGSSESAGQENTQLEYSEPMDIDRPLKSDFDQIDHNWLCDGNLLVLKHAKHRSNLRLFREQWRKNMPVLVRRVDQLMKIDMWLPQYFGKKFGEYRSDLVDCRNGDIHKHSMKKYWEGFEPTNGTVGSKKKVKEDNFSIQVPSANNEELSNGPSYYIGSALWRLKDWPPGQDFYEILPSHYEDFMNNLPLKAYTTRTGKLNLACRLPKEMLKPDLGPKMYSAYGTPKFPERGTTNLHLDISDAINVMVYVSGATSFNNGSEELRESFDKIVNESHIGDDMKADIKDNKLVPGALWHIFKTSDAQKMRDFLNQLADERNISPDKRTDPIHDQTWYLDSTLLERLDKEYGVKSYPILQCMGDAILIPAGAPHQVKNLQNCIKVANDFVSPENVRFCLQLTDEFRSLPETHINQEDKLQIKNIIYHSMKESLQYLACHLRRD